MRLRLILLGIARVFLGASLVGAPQGRAADPPAAATHPEPIDWVRARSLLQREQRGEKLTADEQAYLDRAKAAHRAGARPADPAAATRPAAKFPARESIGIVPLTDLTGDARYKGREGGLYGGGRNAPPEAHLKLAMAEAAKVAPLDADGKPAVDGRIVLLSIGMSNTTQEFSTFKPLADAHAAKNPRLVIVDGAQGGRDAAAWDTAARAAAQDRRGSPWETADARLAAAKVTPNQVQVVWLKQAMIGPGRIGEFPAHSDRLQAHVESILRLAKQRYPNLRLAYLSSRIYAGYANSPLNPEPYAFESAFAVRGVIEKQIAGEASLNPDAARGEVKSPVVLWGPYLWADGTKGRAAGDLAYTREDLASDGTHPSPSGRAKVAKLLLEFFTTDETAKTWFVSPRAAQ